MGTYRGVTDHPDMTDKELIVAYQREKKSSYILEMLSRYEALIFKTIGYWHKMNRNRIFLNYSDREDVKHDSYLTLIRIMDEVDILKIKKFSICLQSRIKDHLWQLYKNRTREISMDTDTLKITGNEYHFKEDFKFHNEYLRLLLVEKCGYRKIAEMLGLHGNRKQLIELIHYYKNKWIQEEAIINREEINNAVARRRLQGVQGARTKRKTRARASV